ncbi:hypothetical protein L0F63_006868, partial [Massospora cicadina]
MSLFPLVGEDKSIELAIGELNGTVYAFGNSLSNSGITVNTSKQCQLCKKEDWKYRCPG